MVIHPLVLQDLVDSGSLRRVIVQNLGDEVASRVADLYVFREVVRIHANTLVGGLDIRGLKWWLTNDQSVDDNADRPDVDLVGMTLLALEYLWRNVVWRTADSALALTIKLKLGG